MCKPDNRKPVSRTLPGLRLRHLREHSGIPIPTVARKLGIAQATLLRIETGDPKIRCRPTMIAELSGIYGATDDVTRALSEAAELIRTGSRFDLHRNVLPLGLERCVDVEQCASMIRSHGAGRVPSLLQTGPYAAAAVGLGESEIWARIRFQQARTDAVQESAARFQFLIGESALVQPVAGAVVMADQLRRINEIGELANVSVRVVPAGFPSFQGAGAGGFEIVDLAEDSGLDGAAALVFIDRPEADWEIVPEVRTRLYEQTFSELLDRALSDEDSRELIGEVARMFSRRCRPGRRLTVVPRVGPAAHPGAITLPCGGGARE